MTIMVLELKAPEDAGLHHLWELWPIAVAYALSFAYIGIYWVNHHQLFSHATKVSGGLLWWNLALLFTLSLIPFSTAYLGTQALSRDASIVYLVTLLLPALAYLPVQLAVRSTGVLGREARLYHHRAIRKGLVTAAIYLAAIPVAFVAPWLAIVTVAVVAVLWFLPKSPLDALFTDPATARR